MPKSQKEVIAELRDGLTVIKYQLQEYKRIGVDVDFDQLCRQIDETLESAAE